MNKLISIIIPTYNYAHLISETLENILKQSYQNWECIIIDDGSTDNTTEIVKGFLEKDIRFIYIKQKNQGPNAARNKGIKIAKGDYIQFLDADDSLETEKLSFQLQYLKQNPHVDIVYGNSHSFTNEKIRNYTPYSMPRVSGTIEEIGATFLKAPITINSALIQKQVFCKVGLPSAKLLIAEDWEFWIRCLNQGCMFHYIDFPNTSALVRRHPNSATQQSWNLKYWIYCMREAVQGYIEIPVLRKLNFDLMQKDKQKLPYLVLKSWKEDKNKRDVKVKMWRTAKTTRSFKYFIYACLISFVNVYTFERLISLSFYNLLIGKNT